VTQPAPTRLPKASSRKLYMILLPIAVFVLLAILVSQTAFELKFLQPGNNQEIVVFAALSALIVVPALLAGRDVIGQAQTGSGKTAAFGLPIIEHVDPSEPEVQALVLTPTLTREHA